MSLLKKIRASALQFAILVGTLVALLLSSFLLLTHTHRFFSYQASSLIESIQTTQERIQNTLREGFSIPENVPNSSYESTQLATTAWGGFMQLRAATTSHNKTFTKSALIGHAKSESPLALHQGDAELPLVVVGNARIVGSSLLSDKGIKAGVISGTYYNGEQLYWGQIETHEGGLPDLHEEWKQQLQGYLNFIPSAHTEFGTIEKSHSNSFHAPLLVSYNSEAARLTEKYTGHLLIWSSDTITVMPQAQLRDVMIVAPHIKIEAGFSGNAHFVSSQSIDVGSGSHLKYPSSLVVWNEFQEPTDSSQEQGPNIQLHENVTFEGTIIQLWEGQGPTQNTSSQIKVDPGVQISGHLYCEGNLQLEGTVHGSVYTQRFITEAGGSRYINHLYDGQIKARQLPEDFGGLPFAESTKTVVQWLY